MPAPHSLDLRQRIVEAYGNGEGSQRRLAKRFKVSRSFIQDLLKLHRETGSLEPKAHGGGASAKIGPAQEPIVRRLVQTTPDATLEELCQDFEQETDIAVSVSTMHRALSALALTYKKNAARLGARP